MTTLVPKAGEIGCRFLSLKTPFSNFSACVVLLGKEHLTQKYQLCIVVAQKR